ncbi:MAG: TVP38/TMEM64 family protein [Proteobacteria bacterium]|nr:TVP38/TMEM64 family protein [Pseudomonadota bacterium]MBU4035941.1 TVP38/TMEM64 family protein [Pseudomonadota bacterium]
MNKNKIFIVLFVVIIIVIFYMTGLEQYMSLDFLKLRMTEFIDYYNSHKLLVIFAYATIYILVTALALPGAAVMTLAGGAVFGIHIGTAIVSISSTVGAALSFAGARYLFRDWIENKYKNNLVKFNEGIEKDSFNYILFLRLVPLFPFFVINLVLGLTRVKFKTYVLTSWIGMLPGTFVFIYAGKQLAGIDSVKSVMSGRVLMALSMLGLLMLVPLFYKKIKSKM